MPVGEGEDEKEVSDDKHCEENFLSTLLTSCQTQIESPPA